MPRKPRIEIAGYYHIINRGVEQRAIFKEASIRGQVTTTTNHLSAIILT